MHDAESYAMQAAMLHDEDRQLSEMYARLAGEELEHAHREHEQAVRIIREYRDAGHEVPVATQAVWDWEHEMMVEDEARIKILISGLR